MTETHRKRFLKKNGLEDKPYSMKQLSTISKVPMKILNEVYKRGIGAYKTQPSSVRLKGSFVKGVKAPMSAKLSKEQWAMARVYSFLDGNPKHDEDLRKGYRGGAGSDSEEENDLLEEVIKKTVRAFQTGMTEEKRDEIIQFMVSKGKTVDEAKSMWNRAVDLAFSRAEEENKENEPPLQGAGIFDWLFRRGKKSRVVPWNTGMPRHIPDDTVSRIPREEATRTITQELPPIHRRGVDEYGMPSYNLSLGDVLGPVINPITGAVQGRERPEVPEIPNPPQPPIPPAFAEAPPPLPMPERWKSHPEVNQPYWNSLSREAQMIIIANEKKKRDSGKGRGGTGAVAPAVDEEEVERLRKELETALRNKRMKKAFTLISALAIAGGLSYGLSQYKGKGATPSRVAPDPFSVIHNAERRNRLKEIYEKIMEDVVKISNKKRNLRTSSFQDTAMRIRLDKQLERLRTLGIPVELIRQTTYGDVYNQLYPLLKSIQDFWERTVDEFQFSDDESTGSTMSTVSSEEDDDEYEDEEESSDDYPEDFERFTTSGTEPKMPTEPGAGTGLSKGKGRAGDKKKLAKYDRLTLEILNMLSSSLRHGVPISNYNIARALNHFGENITDADVYARTLEATNKLTNKKLLPLREETEEDLEGSGRPDNNTYHQIAKEAYNTRGREEVNGWKLVYNTPTLKFYRKHNEVIIGIRGTNPSDTNDLTADALIPMNKLATSARFRNDLNTVKSFQFKNGDMDYYGVGHSLGGAILDLLIKEGLVISGVSYNPAVQPQDFKAKLPNQRIYNKNDPLYNLGKNFLEDKPEVRDNSSFFSRIFGNSPLNSLNAHGLQNFEGGASAETATRSNPKFDRQLKKAGLDTSSYLEEARRKAKEHHYPHKLLGYATDGIHKLAIPDENGRVVSFGRIGYGDHLIYSNMEKAGSVASGTAEKKQNTFHKSHTKIKGDWKKNPFSANMLALKILW